MGIIQKIKDIFTVKCPQCDKPMRWDNGWGRYDCANCLWHEGHKVDRDYKLAMEEIESGTADDAAVKGNE